jgi:hypothetical protein
MEIHMRELSAEEELLISGGFLASEGEPGGSQTLAWETHWIVRVQNGVSWIDDGQNCRLIGDVLRESGWPNNQVSNFLGWLGGRIADWAGNVVNSCNLTANYPGSPFTVTCNLTP